MNFKALGLNLAALLTIVCTSTIPANADQLGCNEGVVEFVQITSMRFDAGVQTLEAFRILRNGMVEWARWNSAGLLLEYSEPSDMGAETFDHVVSFAAQLKPPGPTMDGSALGRPAYRLEITTLTQTGINAVFTHQMPDELAPLIEDLIVSTTATSPQPGWYIWTNPYPKQSMVDIDLTKANHDSVLATALSQSVITGRLISRVDNKIQDFISGERAIRIAFVARFIGGDLRFGVLSAK